MNKRIFAIILLILVLGFGYLLFNKFFGSQKEITLKGKLKAEIATINSVSIGQIKEMYVKNGDFVDKGEKIAEIETLLGRVGDNILGTELTSNGETFISSVYSTSKGKVTNVSLNVGDTVTLYAKILDIIIADSDYIEATIPFNWASDFDFSQVKKSEWINPSDKLSYNANLIYLYPYLADGEIKAQFKIEPVKSGLFFEQTVEVKLSI